MRRTAVTVLAVDRTKRGQIERRDGVDHKPSKVILGQPLPQSRRQKQLLVAVTANEILRPPGRVLSPPDRPSWSRDREDSPRV